MTNLRTNFFVIIILLFTFSCQEEELVSPEPRVESKWLSFNTKRDLESFIENGKTKELDEFKKELQIFNKNGFKPLLPLIDERNEEEMQIYASKKFEEMTRFMQAYYPNASNLRQSDQDWDIDADDDLIVADSYFASVLNEDREILVDNEVYRFTEKGLFHTNIGNYNNLDRTIQLIEPCEMMAIQGETNVGNGVTAFLPKPIEDGCGGGGGGCCSGGGGSGGSGGGSPAPTRDEIRDNLRVCEYRPNVLNKLFGPSETCIDHFEDNRRLKLKTWAQNYLLFASTGVKVKSQRRRFRVWWASAIDELELGYSIASFKYTGIGTWPNPGIANPVDFHYEFNGSIVDQYGRYVSGTTPARNLFSNFPLPNDQQLLKIWVYKPIQTVIKSLTGNSVTYLEYSGKDFNTAVRKLVENAVKELKKKGKNINGKPEAVIIFEDPEWNNMNFVYTNWKLAKTNENKISKVFDWNTAQIGIKSGGSGTNPTYSSPKKPKDFNIVCYGMGRRGSTWKGGRIVLTD